MFDLTGGNYGAKSLGRISLQQVETRRSQRRTDNARPDPELKVPTVELKSRASRARTVRVQSSRAGRAQGHHLPEVQEDSQHTSVLPTTPVRSKRVEFDIVTPKQEDIEALQEAGAACSSPSQPVDAPGSPHNKSKGKLINSYMYSTCQYSNHFSAVES